MSMPINYLIYFTWSENFLLLFYYIFNILTNIIFLLLTIALFTVVERKIMAALQKRKGPNVHGFWGSLQAFSDGLKLLLKEDFVPSIANTFLFRIAPIYTFFIALSSWAIIPFSNTQGYFFSNLGILYVFALSSLGVYGIILSGWASNSKYSFLGALRSAAQMISYEVSIGFVIITICMICGTLSLVKIVVDQFFFWFLVPFFPLFLIFLISIVAETNRAPFDLPEAEAELVSGYNVEYGGISFALFFLAEYSNIILMSTLTVLLFMGGWWPLFQSFFIFNSFFNFFFIFWLSLKLQIILGLFVWLRVSFPRYRYDQLMLLGWNVLLPWSLSLFFSYSFFIFYYDAVPSYNISYFSYIPTYNFFCFDLNEYYSERYSELDCKNVNDILLKNATYDDVLNYNEEKTFKYYHIFERINWQKYLYLDVKAKYLNIFNNDTFSFFNIFYKENFEFFENLNQNFIKHFFNFSISNSLNYFFFDASFVTKYSIKLFFDNLLYNNNITFISIKQCFSFLCDPSFNLVDVYARGIFFDFSQSMLNWSSTAKISYVVLRDCHNVWWSFYNFLSPFKTLQIYSFLPLSNKLLYFFKYDIKTLPLNFQFEYLQLKQSVLTLLIILDKFRVLDFFMLTNIEKFNKILILFSQPSLYLEDDLEIFSILFKKIEPFSNFIAMKYKDVFESFDNYHLIEKNNLNININITLKK